MSELHSGWPLQGWPLHGALEVVVEQLLLGGNFLLLLLCCWCATRRRRTWCCWVLVVLEVFATSVKTEKTLLVNILNGSHGMDTFWYGSQGDHWTLQFKGWQSTLKIAFSSWWQCCFKLHFEVPFQYLQLLCKIQVKYNWSQFSPSNLVIVICYFSSVMITALPSLLTWIQRCQRGEMPIRGRWRTQWWRRRCGTCPQSRRTSPRSRCCRTSPTARGSLRSWVDLRRPRNPPNHRAKAASEGVAGRRMAGEGRNRGKDSSEDPQTWFAETEMVIMKLQ